MLGLFVFQITPDTLINWKSSIGAVSNIITAISATVIAIAAIPGINAWKKQLQGQTKYELARRYLRSVYKVRDAIRNARRPDIPYSEFLTSLEKQGFDTEDINNEAKKKRAVYSERWEKVANALLDLSVESLEVEVIWGKTYLEAEKELRIHAGKLKLNFEWHLDDRRPFSPERLVEIDSIIYRKEGDEFDKKLDSILTPIEEGMRKYIG